MSTMITEGYDALREAGASEDKSRKAAEAVASFENRFPKIETELAVLKWMSGSTIALVLLALGKLFTAH
jgi:hypothetical protein